MTLALLVGLLMSGCGGGGEPAGNTNTAGDSAPNSTGGAAANATLTLVVPTPQAVAALVNDEPIPLVALERAVERRLAGIRAVNDPMPADIATFRQTVLDVMIEQVLIEQAAKIQNVIVTDDEVDTEVQLTVNEAGGREKWLRQLEGDAMSEADFRSGLRSALVTQKMRDIVTKSACVSIEQVHARHILVPDEATAVQIRQRLDQGEAFPTLAAQYSLDVSTKQTGGDLGWFSRGQLLQIAVEEAAFSLEINAFSPPIKSDLGYHIVQALEKVKDRPIDLDTCFRLSEAAFERWLQDLVSKAKIEKFPNGR
jgi:PPIC-type PPIASE domain/SurA N-terminal domain